MLTNALAVAGVMLFCYGVVGLIAVWLVPSLQGTGLWGKRVLTGRLHPTRFNQSLMCLWALFFGGYISLSALELRAWGYGFAAAFFLCAAVALIRRTSQAGEP